MTPRKGKKFRRSEAVEDLRVTHAHAAGIDVHSAVHFVAVPVADVPQGFINPDAKLPAGVRKFGTNTGDLEALAAWLKDCGVQTIRVATHCTEADVSEQHIALARKLGMDTVGFLMMSHMASPATLVSQAKLMESYGANCIYITDSAGYLLPDVLDTIDLNLRLGRRTNAAIRCAGVSLNTSRLNLSDAARLMDAESARLGVPVADPMRPGAAFEKLVDKCLA